MRLGNKGNRCRISVAVAVVKVQVNVLLSSISIVK